MVKLAPKLEGSVNKLPLHLTLVVKGVEVFVHFVVDPIEPQIYLDHFVGETKTLKNLTKNCWSEISRMSLTFLNNKPLCFKSQSKKS